MAIGVQIYGLETSGEAECKGSLYLDGKTIRASNPNNPTLAYILGRPAAGPQSDMKPITWQQDPLMWLNNLRTEYRGFALYASPVQELDQPEYPSHSG